MNPLTERQLKILRLIGSAENHAESHTSFILGELGATLQNYERVSAEVHELNHMDLVDTDLCSCDSGATAYTLTKAGRNACS